ncbi:2-keto-3-deoxygluconate permease [Paracidovorax citrulli AAC00-1]|uniref:2-keto-3-deoxygluconate permease n=2 Tax=Paracidovorax citrulli TaxID=80869 RepID=A1TTY4_PARC0|nr:2-keto-3-deoxygluconate permease [Paracidovorax citrulli AAC00-1]
MNSAISAGKAHRSQGAPQYAPAERPAQYITMKIKSTIEKIPGGMMLVPLLLGAALHTVRPDTGKYYGSFTQGLISGVVPILAVWMFCLGASIHLRATGALLRKSGALVGAKIGTAWLAAWLLPLWIPVDGLRTGFFAGLSVLAVVAALDMTNGGLYASIMEEHGTREEAGVSVLIGLESGPLVTMLILGSTGLAAFEPRLLVGVAIPFIAGFVLGNLDPELRSFFSPATRVLIPFFAFALGNTIDLRVVVEAGMPGIAMALAVMAVSGTALVLADIFIGGGRGTAGIAASSTAGAAVATPHLVAQAAPQFATVAPSATALVAACVVITAVLVPLASTWWASRVAPRIHAMDGQPS